MKKGCLFLFAFIIFFAFPSQAAVFRPYSIKTIQVAYYFTPAVSSKRFAVLGYASKIKPTMQEIRNEKKRISRIIDEGIRREYGSIDKFKEAISELVKDKHIPLRLKKAIPFLLQGALLLAKLHPEAMREPVGSVGKTGIIVVDSKGSVNVIPLGINAPVTSIDISPKGKLAVVETDMSYEDRGGNLHPVGEISLVDLYVGRRICSWILSNLAGNVAFAPTERLIAFDIYTDMHDFSKKELRFIDIRSKRITKVGFPIWGSVSASVFGRNIHYPGFVCAPNSPVVATYDKGRYRLYNIKTGKKLLTVSSSAAIAFAHRHPYLFTGRGELWDYVKKKCLKIVEPKKKIPFTEVAFGVNDDSIYYLKFGIINRFDLKIGRVVASTCWNVREVNGLFSLSPDGHFVISFSPGKGLISYKGRYLRRQQLYLRIFDAKDLRNQQDIIFRNSTVIDAAMAGKLLAVSDFERLHLYREY